MSMKLNNLALPSSAQLSNYDDSMEISNTRLETNVVRPTSFSDVNGRGEVTFVIPPIGILHDIMLTFSLNTPGPQYTLGSYPCGSVGIAGIIDELYLSIGGTRVCSVSSFGDRFSSKRSFRDMSDRQWYDTYKYGTNDAYQVKINNAGNAHDGVGFRSNVYDPITRIGSNANVDSSSSFRLNLKDMFEFFNENFDLPAFTLDADQVIKLHLKLKNESDWGDRAVTFTATANGPAFDNCAIVRDSCKLYVDSVFLDEARMLTIQQQYAQGTIIKYGDVESTKTSSNIASQTNKSTFTLNGTGKVVTGISFCVKPDKALKREAYYHTYGAYYSFGYDRTGYNIQLNNKNVLNTNSENMLNIESDYLYGTFNKHNDFIDQPLGMLDFQSGDDVAVSDTAINGSVGGQRDHYAGLQKYFGLSFGKGVKVSNVAPTLELYRNNETSAVNIGNSTLVTFVDVVRYFSIRNGRVNVTY